MEFVSQQGIKTGENATDKSYLMLTVSETGTDLAENDLAVIFEPYAQLDRPNKKNIVKYLKGAVWIESEPMRETV